MTLNVSAIFPIITAPVTHTQRIDIVILIIISMMKLIMHPPLDLEKAFRYVTPGIPVRNEYPLELNVPRLVL